MKLDNCRKVPIRFCSNLSCLFSFQEAYKSGEPCQEFTKQVQPVYDDILSKKCDPIVQYKDNLYWDAKMKAKKKKFDTCQKKGEQAGNFGDCREKELTAAILSFECKQCSGGLTTSMVGHAWKKFSCQPELGWWEKP